MSTHRVAAELAGFAQRFYEALRGVYHEPGMPTRSGGPRRPASAPPRGADDAIRGNAITAVRLLAEAHEVLRVYRWPRPAWTPPATLGQSWQEVDAEAEIVRGDVVIVPTITTAWTPDADDLTVEEPDYDELDGAAHQLATMLRALDESDRDDEDDHLLARAVALADAALRHLSYAGAPASEHDRLPDGAPQQAVVAAAQPDEERPPCRVCKRRPAARGRRKCDACRQSQTRWAVPETAA